MKTYHPDGVEVELVDPHPFNPSRLWCLPLSPAVVLASFLTSDEPGFSRIAKIAAPRDSALHAAKRILFHLCLAGKFPQNPWEQFGLSGLGHLPVEKHCADGGDEGGGEREVAVRGDYLEEGADVEPVHQDHDPEVETIAGRKRKRDDLDETEELTNKNLANFGE